MNSLTSDDTIGRASNHVTSTQLNQVGNGSVDALGDRCEANGFPANEPNGVQQQILDDSLRSTLKVNGRNDNSVSHMNNQLNSDRYPLNSVTKSLPKISYFYAASELELLAAKRFNSRTKPPKLNKPLESFDFEESPTSIVVNRPSDSLARTMPDNSSADCTVQLFNSTCKSKPKFFITQNNLTKPTRSDRRIPIVSDWYKENQPTTHTNHFSFVPELPSHGRLSTHPNLLSRYAQTALFTTSTAPRLQASKTVMAAQHLVSGPPFGSLTHSRTYSQLHKTSQANRDNRHRNPPTVKRHTVGPIPSQVRHAITSRTDWAAKYLKY